MNGHCVESNYKQPFEIGLSPNLYELREFWWEWIDLNDEWLIFEYFKIKKTPIK
jgi:hypothetical protein